MLHRLSDDTARNFWWLVTNRYEIMCKQAVVILYGTRLLIAKFAWKFWVNPRKNLSQQSRSLVGDTRAGPPEYEAGTLITWPRRFAGNPWRRPTFHNHHKRIPSPVTCYSVRTDWAEWSARIRGDEWGLVLSSQTDLQRVHSLHGSAA